MSKKPHVLIFYRNFKAVSPQYKHVGLGINGMHVNKTLRSTGVQCDLIGIGGKDISTAPIIESIKQYETATHVVIEAIWLSTANTLELCHKFPNIQFVIRCHSQIGFLQVEAGAIKIMRELLREQEMLPNLHLAGNSLRFCNAIVNAYNSKCIYLPNLYYNDSTPKFKAPHKSKTLKVGMFGATRLMKNFATCAVAAVALAKMRHCNLELYINTDREEQGPGVQGVMSSIRNLVAELPDAKIIEVPWQEWGLFKHTVGSMDICFQLSYSETFNLVTADACAAGVPSIVGEAIDWIPFKANVDDPTEAAIVANNVLDSKTASYEAFRSLNKYNKAAIGVWTDWLNSSNLKSPPKKWYYLWLK